MSLSCRATRTYYYRSTRVDGRPRNIYVGAGEKAAAAATEDVARRQRQAVERAAEQAHFLTAHAPILAAEIMLDELLALIQVLVGVTLLLTGHHQHNGLWRRRVLAWPPTK